MTNDTTFMLTTVDNPYNPFDDYIDWFMYDISQSRNTSGYLMRVARITDDMSEVEENKEIERAIDKIVSTNPLGLYTKVSR